MRFVQMKYENNAQMVGVMQKAIGLGLDAIIITPRVDVAGCGYVWVGLRKGQTELQGKLLLNAQIWAYLLAALLGEELPKLTTATLIAKFAVRVNGWKSWRRKSADTRPSVGKNTPKTRKAGRVI